MATDAKFDKIQQIIPHENADALEIAIVSNFPCVVKKDTFKAGDVVFYIRDDAKLVEYDAWKEFMKRYEDPSALIPQDCYHPEKFAWQEGLLKYLGGGGRVRTIKLRGKTSMGILMKPEELGLGSSLTWEGAEKVNAKIADPESGSAFLEKTFGVVHWTAPFKSFGQLNVKYAGLPEGIAKSDSENWENLAEDDLHLGKHCLITQKLDGTSTLTTCYPDGHYEVSGRSNTFKEATSDAEENIYQKFTHEIARAGLWYAKKHNKIVAFRSETCCSSVQRNSANKDWKRDDSFVYGCEFPEEEGFFMKHGCYGTENHFLKVVEECNANGFKVKHVPIIGEGIVTKELLKRYNDMPADFEGVVLNIDCSGENPFNSLVWQYKSKSRAYLMKVG